MKDLSAEFKLITGLKNEPAQVPEELALFIRYIRYLKLDHVLEIGAGHGGTAEVFSHLAKNLISIDFGEPRFDVLDIHSRCNYRYLRGNSHYDESPAEVASILITNQLDLLFIDGDHTYAGAKLDFLLYKGFVAHGGLIVFHDIIDSERHKSINCNVHILWKEVKQNYRSKEIIANEKWGGIGIIRNERYGKDFK